MTLGTTFGYVGGGVISYIAYANWVGLHKWGLTGHQDIEAIRDRAFRSESIDYLPDDPQQIHHLRQRVARCAGTCAGSAGPLHRHRGLYDFRAGRALPARNPL